MKNKPTINESMEFFIQNAIQTSKRYIEAEKFIVELYCLPWYKRFFIRKRISKYITDVLTKYNF